VGFAQIREATPEFLTFAAQFGATDVMLADPGLPAGDGRWHLKDLVKLRLSVEQYGLHLETVEAMPVRFYDHIILGGPRRDEQMQNMVETVRAVGRAGIPIFGYHWLPSEVWRTPHADIRAGAMATAFDYDFAKRMPLTHGREYSEEELWENLEYWITTIAPVAEEAGVRLAVHPCDPPVARLGGIPMLLRSFDAFKRLMEAYPSDSNAIKFCQGTFAEMAGEDVYDIIRHFGERKKIAYVHFRNVSSTVPRFSEEFPNTGYVDMYRAMKIYHEVGFDGVFVDDHAPHTHGDSAWGHRERAFACGYIQAMIEAVQSGSAASSL